MKEKLVELLRQCVMQNVTIDPDCWDAIIDVDYAEMADSLMESGVVVLPCKVGDTVWVINRHMNAVFENTVISFHCGHSSDLKNYIKTRWVGERGNESIRKWTFRQIGRYVFLTREEAEAALKEGE